MGSRRFKGPYLGLLLKEINRIQWHLTFAFIFSILAGLFLYFLSSESSMVKAFVNVQGTRLELFRMLLPFFCVVTCLGFSRKIISEEITNGSWRFHQHLSVTPNQIYISKFVIGLLASIICIVVAQVAFLLASSDQIVITWKHYIFPAARLISVTACVWSMFFFSTILGSLRWPSLICIGVIYLINTNTIAPFYLLRGEGILEEVGTFPELSKLGLTWFVTSLLFCFALIVIRLQSTSWVNLLYKPMSYKVKFILIGIVIAGFMSSLYFLEIDSDEKIQEQTIKSFGQVIPSNSGNLAVECWVPEGCPDEIQNNVVQALPGFERQITSIKEYIDIYHSLPKCVIILRPDLENPTDWETSTYNDLDTIVIRIYPDASKLSSLDNILANLYLTELIQESVLDTPIGLEQFGWLASGLPQYLAPVDQTIYSKEKDIKPIIEWLSTNSLVHWPSVRDGKMTNGKYDPKPTLNEHQRSLASWSMLKVCEQRYGSKWLQELCFESLAINNSKSQDTSLAEYIWLYYDIVAYVYYARKYSARNLFLNKGGKETNLTLEASDFLKNHLKSSANS